MRLDIDGFCQISHCSSERNILLCLFREPGILWEASLASGVVPQGGWPLPACTQRERERRLPVPETAVQTQVALLESSVLALFQLSVLSWVVGCHVIYQGWRRPDEKAWIFANIYIYIYIQATSNYSAGICTWGEKKNGKWARDWRKKCQITSACRSALKPLLKTAQQNGRPCFKNRIVFLPVNHQYDSDALHGRACSKLH